MRNIQIQEEAQRVLKQEAEALMEMARLLDGVFVKAAQLLFEAQGKVILSGVGKSDLVSRKMAATFTSTGTPAVCMHATDALHGDVGIVQPGDVAILISRSGATQEVLALLPVLKARNIPVIGITCFSDSPLAQKSDIHLEVSGKEEACPYNLAPTTSTTATMAIGDALAVCLLKMRNFTDEDFARVHPAGSLGRQLLLKARDLIRREAAVVQPDSPMEHVILAISAGRSGAAVVADENRKVLGIITDGDLRRLISRSREDFRTIPAREVMSSSPRTADPDIPATAALLIMEEARISQLILCGPDQKLAGLIHLHDIIAEGIRT